MKYATSKVVDEVTEALRIFNRSIDMVMREKPGPRRWVAAHNLWLSMDPLNPTRRRLVAQENKEFRELQKNKNATIKATYRVPVSAQRIIQTADPLAFSEANRAKFIKTFPEYSRIPE